MKKAIALLLLCAQFGYGQAFPTNINQSTVNIDKQASDYNDFRWTWKGYEDQIVSLTTSNDSGYVVVSNWYGLFKVSKRTPSGSSLVTYIDKGSSDVSITDSNLQTTVAHTNIPPNDSYLAEWLLISTTNTNVTRTLARGRIDVQDSLYGSDDSSFNFPTNSGWSTNGVEITTITDVNLFHDGTDVVNVVGSDLNLHLNNVSSIDDIGSTQATHTANIDGLFTTQRLQQASIDNLEALSNGVIYTDGRYGMQADFNIGSNDLTEVESIIAAASKNMLMYINTSDGSDTNTAGLSGAGGFANTRGAYVAVYGNENASLPGSAIILLGAGVNSVMRFSGSATFADLSGTTGDWNFYGNAVSNAVFYGTTGTTINEFSTDGTLAGDSDLAVPTEKAVKAFAENAANLTNQTDYLVYNVIDTNATYHVQWAGPWDEARTIAEVFAKADSSFTINVIEQASNASWWVYTTNVSMAADADGTFSNAFTDATIAAGNMLGVETIGTTASNGMVRIKLNYD